MNDRPRILFLLPHLGGGGTERVLTLVSSSLDTHRYDVHMATLAAPMGGEVKLAESVTLHALETGRVRRSGPALVRLVRRLRPQLIVGGIYHLNLLLLALRPLFPAGTRIVVRQNGSVASTLAANRNPRLLRQFYSSLYPRADRILCQSEAMAEELAELLPRSRDLLTVVPNPLDDAAVKSAAAAGPGMWNGGGPHLLAMGRLSPEKGFDLLVEALVHVRTRWPRATLTIAGEGPARPAIETQIRLLGLENWVQLPGATSNPWALFAGVQLFVLPSRADAMPNALLEAAAAELPIVVTHASPALTALVAGQPGVWLAEKTTSQSLAEAIGAALVALQPNQRFPHSFLDPFRLENALPRWEAAFQVALNKESA